MPFSLASGVAFEGFSHKAGKRFSVRPDRPCFLLVMALMGSWSVLSTFPHWKTRNVTG